MPYYVYKITHKKSGRLYFGITRNDPGRRLRQHYNDIRGDRVITRAMRKYGLPAFKIDVVEEHPTEALCREREIFFIALHDTTNRKNGFNVSPGGDYDCRWWDYASDDQKQAFGARSSRVLQSWWNAQSSEDKAARGELIRQHIANLPEKDRERRAEQSRINGAAYWETISPEALEEFRAEATDRANRRWARATARERAEVGERSRAAWWAKPEEERANIAARRGANRKANFEAKSPKEQRVVRRRASKAVADAHARMSPDQKAARVANRLATLMAKPQEERSAAAALGWSNMSERQRARRCQNLSKAAKANADANPDIANEKAAQMRAARTAQIAERDKNLTPKELREKEMARARSRKYMERKRREQAG